MRGVKTAEHFYILANSAIATGNALATYILESVPGCNCAVHERVKVFCGFDASHVQPGSAPGVSFRAPLSKLLCSFGFFSALFFLENTLVFSQE